MISTDPIADMLSRIRNAIAVNRNIVSVPHSKLKQTIAQQLVDNNFIESLEVDGEGITKQILIHINPPGQNARITTIERVSKPGRRMYAKAAQIPHYKNGRGLVIVSTSQGIMTGGEASRRKLGGELICRVY